ncbi:MAG: dephospho-CoA kinase [Butyricicoccus sp.]|nr:dephospho-CoA kinase [Butyricicoccus sp.]
MQIIGLTGGSGAGKTAVSACFEALGAGAVDADAVYRTLCAESRPMLDALDAAFGGVLTPEGALDRPKLANIVFSDPEKLKQLNEITFPYIRAASEARFMELARSGHTIILYDAPTLYQTGADALCGDVIGVIASRETRIARIISRDGLSREAAAARIDAQPDADFYRRRCRFVIENDGDLAALERQARDVWAQLNGK